METKRIETIKIMCLMLQVMHPAVEYSLLPAEIVLQDNHFGV